MFELVPLLGNKDFEKMWLQLCRLTAAPADVLTKDKTTGNEGADASYVNEPRLAAYAYSKTGNTAFAKKALTAMLSLGSSIADPHVVSGSDSLNPVHEDLRVNTNSASQDALSTIEFLELCKDQLPTAAAVRTPRQPRTPPPTPAGPGRGSAKVA